MRTLLLLTMHVLTTLAERVGLGGTKALIAESLLVKTSTADCPSLGRKNATPNTLDRFLCGFLSLLVLNSLHGVTL